jgi:ubiquinone/menaquinone biosynthesis C-methylase UbiE
MGKIGNLIYSVYTEKKKVDLLQQKIRNTEWDSISTFILNKSTFLDVGCGTGYSMLKAKAQKNCLVSGIDPNPGLHGVGRFANELQLSPNIIKAHSENIPFENHRFDVVYSSHVLEHVNDEKRTLQEIKRVMKNDGILIIGMPTATMAFINLISSLTFTTHIKIYETIRGMFIGTFWKNAKRIFHIPSHSNPKGKSIIYDLKNYKITSWKKLIEEEFEIEKTILPCLYPYPDYPQFFKLKKNKYFSSSVFFICRKK